MSADRETLRVLKDIAASLRQIAGRPADRSLDDEPATTRTRITEPWPPADAA